MSKRKGSTHKFVKLSSIYMYVAAITYLYTQQVPSRINSNEHPRVACRKLIKACQRREELTKRANFEDRGVNAVLDGYSTSEEIPRIVNYYINKNNLSNLRNGLAFLLSHFCLLRGESARGAEFPDLQTINLEGEGPSQQACPALILVMKNGKTNKNGRLEVSACMRNVDYKICPFMMLGLYFFQMYHVECRSFPDFTTSRN